MFDSIDDQILNALEGMNEKEVKEVLRYIQFVKNYPHLGAARQWLLNTFTNHPHAYMIAINTLMSLAPLTKILK